MLKEKQFVWRLCLMMLTCMVCSSLFEPCRARAEEAYYYQESTVMERETYIKEDRRFFPRLRFDGDGNLIYAEAETDDVKAIYKQTEGEDEVLFRIPDRNVGWTPTADGNYDGYHVARSFDMDASGNFYILYSTIGSGDLVLDVYTKDGTPLKTDITIADSEKRTRLGMVMNFRYDRDRVFILHPNGKLCVYSMDGTLVNRPFENYFIGDFTMDASGILYMIVSVNAGSGTFELLMADSKEDFKVLNRVSLPNVNGVVYCVEETGSVYIATNMNVYKYDVGDENVTKELILEDTSLLLSNNPGSDMQIFDGFAADAAGRMYFVTHAQTKEKARGTLYMLEKKAGVKPEQSAKNTLVITAAYQQNYLREAARRYVHDHPEVKIEWDILYSTENAFFADNDVAAKKLTTKIMANDVGDIVATGGMNLSYYDILQTDAFIDLTANIAADANHEAFNQYVLNAMTIDGTLKGIPVGIAYETLVYHCALGERLGLQVDDSLTWSDILEIGLTHPEVPLFGGSHPEMILYHMLIAQMPDLIDLNGRTVDLHQEWFLKLLTDFKALYQQMNLTISSDQDFFKKIDRNYLFELRTLRGQYDHVVLYYENAEGTIAYLPMPAGEKNRNAVAYPILMYSISNNSSQKEVAWDFLSYLLSPEMQREYSLAATPIHTIVEKEIRTKHGEIAAELDAQLDKIVHTIDYLYDMGYYKMDIGGLLGQYVSDKITLEEALEKAEYNVWIRLNE